MLTLLTLLFSFSAESTNSSTLPACTPLLILGSSSNVTNSRKCAPDCRKSDFVPFIRVSDLDLKPAVALFGEGFDPVSAATSNLLLDVHMMSFETERKHFYQEGFTTFLCEHVGLFGEGSSSTRFRSTKSGDEKGRSMASGKK